MTTSTLSQHDSLFKKFLGDIAVARDFLEIHLPPHLRERRDFSTLAMDDLRTQCSDMLYSVQTKTGKGYIYTLIEHQSRPEKLMAWRLMRYSMAAMQRHLEQGNETLPVVIPLLFYHGTTSPTPTAPNGSIALLTLNWQNQSIHRHSRWLILPLCRMMKYSLIGG